MDFGLYQCLFCQPQKCNFMCWRLLVGLVMGGIQSLSRSTYSKFIPEDTADTASFFSFYDVTEKLAIVAGLASFAYIEELTGSMRNSTIALTSFFILGLLLLLSLRRAESKLLAVPVLNPEKM